MHDIATPEALAKDYWSIKLLLRRTKIWQFAKTFGRLVDLMEGLRQCRLHSERAAWKKICKLVKAKVLLCSYSKTPMHQAVLAVRHQSVARIPTSKLMTLNT